MQPWADPDSGAVPPGGRTAGPRVGVYRPPAPGRRHGLRPLATFEIVDQATRFWRRRLGTVAAVTVAATLPVRILAAVACRTEFTCTGERPSVVAAAFGGDGRSDPVLLLALALLAALSAQVAAAAIARLVAADRLGDTLGAGAALRASLRPRALVAVASAWVLGHLVAAVSAVTFVGPLAVMALYLAATPAIAVEGLGPVAGLRRSWRLGQRRFFPMLGVAVASGLVALLLSGALALLPVLVGSLGPLERWTWLVQALASQLQLVVTVPLTAAAATLAYLDVRVRTEGLDLQVDLRHAFTPGADPALVG